MFRCWLKKFATVWAWIVLGCAAFAEAAWIFITLSVVIWNTPFYAAPMFFGLLISTVIGFCCYVECNDARKRALDDAEYDHVREERAKAHRQHAKDLAAIKAGTYVGG